MLAEYWEGEAKNIAGNIREEEENAKRLQQHGATPNGARHRLRGPQPATSQSPRPGRQRDDANQSVYADTLPPLGNSHGAKR